MNEENRYYQPKDSKDAMRYVEKLFNKYKNAPLTDALLQYHQKLIYYLQTSVITAAQQEHQPQREKAAKNMIAIMQDWIRVRALGQTFNGSLKGFKVTKNKHIKYKHARGKLHNQQSTIRKTMH